MNAKKRKIICKIIKKKYPQKFFKMERNVRNDVSECVVFNVAPCNRL